MAAKSHLLVRLSLIALSVIVVAYQSSATSITDDFDGDSISSSTSKFKRSDASSVFANIDHSVDLFSTTNQYLSSQAQKFRVNVSNVCEKNHMRATIRLNKPFYGIIHARDKRKKPNCVVEGTGDQTYTMDISYTLVQSEQEFCGVVSHQPSTSQRQSSSSLQLVSQSSENSTAPQVPQQQPTLSIVLVVRLHKTIEFSEDRYFLLSCLNRCSRPDCSSKHSVPTSHLPIQLAHQSYTNIPAHLHDPISESASRQSSVNQLQTTDLTALANLCDTSSPTLQYSSRLQWLVKLCIVLGVLFLMALSAALYLCFVLNKSKRDRGIKQRMLAKQNGIDLTSDPARPVSDSYVIPSATQSESMSWTATSGSNGDGVEEKHLIDTMRDDNSYLIKQQHQRLLMANGLIGSEDQELEFSRQQQQANVENQRILPCNQQLVFGRSAIDQLERMKRRRSIGSSMVLARKSVMDKHGGKISNSSNNVHFDDKQRAKSRSQTTIYYGQSQDPFKAIPFCNTQSGYLSDGASINASAQRSTRNVAPSVMPELYNTDYNTHSQRNQHHLAYPSNTISTACMVKHNNRWALKHHDNSVPMPPPPPPPPTRAHLLPSSSQHVESHRKLHMNSPNTHLISQFDPRHNSRQLSDLIQQKHQQHIEQANMTKASLQGSAATLDQFDHDRVFWK